MVKAGEQKDEDNALGGFRSVRRDAAAALKYMDHDIVL